MLAGAVAALLFGATFAMTGAGAVPAFAGPDSVLQLSKKVNGQDAVRELEPGTTVTYTVNFSVENELVLAPVVVTDVLPAEFEGWEIIGLSATVNGSNSGVTVDLPGIAGGAGTIGAGEANRTIGVNVNRPVNGGTGMSADDQGLLTYQIKVPEDLSPEWIANNQDLINIAVFSADSNDAITVADSAIISVDVPVTIDVTPAKSWNPSEQGFEVGASSLVTIAGTQSSNIDASKISLQDPADPALAADGATELDAANPFNFVDFAGFANPSDPTTNLPAGATDSSVEVYYYNGTTWNWTVWDDSLTLNNIAGVRTVYTGTFEPGTNVSQGFNVEQRETHRTSDERLSEGYTAENDVRATVEAEGHEPVSKDAEANLVVGPQQIEVQAGKSFLDPETGEELTSLTAIGGETVGVVLHARNQAVPQSSLLDSLTISEPGDGADPAYFSDDLQFAGFNTSNPAAAWPTGATDATLTWTFDDGTTQDVILAAGDPLPVIPAGKTVAGFEITYTSTTGGIAPNTVAEIGYSIKTSENLGEPNAPAGPFTNVIDVTGTREGLDDVSDDAEASLTVVAPSIEVDIEKRISPSIVQPGDDVIVQLPTTATAAGSETKPTEIVVTDEYSGDGTFWDAYDVTKIIAPVQVFDGELTVSYRDDSGVWHDLPVFTSDITSDVDLTAYGEITGIKFTFSNEDGFATSQTVKPNLGFTARENLRSSGEPTAPYDEDNPLLATPYENTAVADATGKLGEREVTDTDEDTAVDSIRPDEAFGPGPLWADKQWQDPTTLVSQSGATPSSDQRWALTEEGYAPVQLTDPGTPTANGVGTVFEAFDLKAVKPITLDQDPALAWDSVTAVELYNGTTWVPVTAPGTGWMGTNGFVGYTLTTVESGWALGIRLTIDENPVSRAAAAAAEDIGAPAVGSGVTASAAVRGYTLDWQLRNSARGTAADAPKWVTDDATFNCGVAPGDPGCIDNVFTVTGFPTGGGSPVQDSDNDEILLIDGVPSVSLEKSVANDELVAPNFGDHLAPADYPTTSYTLTAQNNSAVVAGAEGAMKLSRLRVTDVASSSLGNSSIGVSPFVGRSFSSEAATNHFDEFNLTGISFTSLPSFIDKTQSLVELWLFSDQANPVTYSIAEIEAGDANAQLADVIGVSVTYQGTDPEINGNRIVAGEDLTMNLAVQLRAEHRQGEDPVVGGPEGSTVRVANDAFALGEDLVVNPELEPTDGSDAHVDLVSADIEVFLDKSITVANTLPGAGNDTIYEADPQAPATVTLVANPGDSTAPLQDLTIEDSSSAFWERFEFVSFGTAGLPLDADQTTQYVLVGSDWVEFSQFVTDGGDLADIVGVRTVFDRADGELFPQGSTSWSESWGSATMPFVVQLRADAEVDWASGDDITENTASTEAKRTDTDTATDEADAEVGFEAGENRITVSKRAPNDTGTHQVNPLDSLQWQLIFTNSGSSLLPIEDVTDALPESLKWDGEQPSFSSTGTGITVNPDDITVTPSADGRELVFGWPEGSRMNPGESVAIELGLILQPGLLSGERATNSVVVETGVELAGCTQPTNNGQLPEDPASSTECGNTNYVSPLIGTYVNGAKTVNGEIVETDGEFLVSGGSRVDSATKLPSGEACDTANWSDDDYTRTPCIAYTAAGAVDSWKLDYYNIGTNPLGKIVIVDMLPEPGDSMLAGYGFARGSNFRPVIDLESAQVERAPADASVTIEVTTNAAACYSTGSAAPNRWTDDPTCENTTTNPANDWVALDDYIAGGGSEADIAGIRATFDLTANPLLPGQNVLVTYQTQNRVIDNAEGGLLPTLADYQTPRVAWNQSGVMAWDVTGSPIPLPKAPPVAGVTVKTADLVVSKDVLGDAANAPATFPVALDCTIPDGLGGRTAFDMGEYSMLEVPGHLPGTAAEDRQSVTVPNVPLGVNCEIAEVSSADGEPVVGEFGEIGRSIQAGVGVNPSEDGLTAEVRVRDNGAGSQPTEATFLALANTYGLGDLVIEKAVRSTTEYDLSDEQLAQEFGFEVVCVAGDTVDTRDVTVKAGEQTVVTDLPAGANCAVTETEAGDAVETTVTVAGDVTEGDSREDIVLSEDGTHVLFTNGLEGPKPPVTPGAGDKGGLSLTGSNMLWALGAIALLGLVAGAVLMVRRRREV